MPAPNLRVTLAIVIGTFLPGATLVGCSGAPAADDDHPRDVIVVAPRLAPPPARGAPLDREAALAVARRHLDAADAIAELDARRLGFPLDDPALEWFGEQGLEPAVLDYLRKRAKVDWESLRGDVDPDGPQ